MNDWELIQAYCRNGSESAFETLVKRHVDFVYCSALRQLRDPLLAEDVSQAVFLLLVIHRAGQGVGGCFSRWIRNNPRVCLSSPCQVAVVPVLAAAGSTSGRATVHACSSQPASSLVARASSKANLVVSTGHVFRGRAGERRSGAAARHHVNGPRIPAFHEQLHFLSG
jgi:hypothetical protein